MITQFLDKTRDLVFKALFKRVIITRVSLDEYNKFLEPLNSGWDLVPMECKFLVVMRGVRIARVNSRNYCNNAAF